MALDAQSSVLKPTGNIWRQLVRYGLSGGVATVVDMAMLWLCTSCLGWYYQIGVCAGYLLGLIITYLMSTLWIFDEHRTDKRWLEFVGFAMIGLIGLGATHLSMWFFTDICFGEEQYMLSKLITVVLVSLLNFILKKLILFSR